MWFNLLKLDLSSLSRQSQGQFQGDADGRNINIKVDDKCRKKLINFQKRLMRLSRRNKGVYFNDESTMSNMPEHIACELVEKVDEMFNSITSFSYPVEAEIDKGGELSNGVEYVLMYYSNDVLRRSSDDSAEYVGEIVLVIYCKTDPETPVGGYFTRIIIESEDPSLMQAVKKHWELS